jgi:uncharacterized membrane protein YbhN (UPF0104 family)
MLRKSSPHKISLGRRRKLPTWIQAGASLALLASTLYFVDRAEIWRRLHQMRAGWLVLTLVLLLVQFAALAARWWFFARKLSAPIGYARALAEYFLAGFLNQVLPFGILGDVTRAIRHTQFARTDPASGSGNGRVVLAIVLERAAGQLGLWLVVAAILPGWWSASRSLAGRSLTIVVLTGLLIFMSAAIAWIAWRRRLSPNLKRLLSEGWRALFAPANLAVHLPLSLFLVATHALAFVAIAHGLGLQLSFTLAIRVVPLVLVATTLPFFMAGWGVREATIAGLYHLAGLPGTDGVTISLVYGCLCLLASVPGVLALRRGTARQRVPHLVN